LRRLATTLRRKSLQWRGAPLVRARLAVAREAGALPEIKCDFSPLEILN
jgi:hypothetical protein